MVRLKKQLRIKTVLITEPDSSTPVDEIGVGVLEKKKVASERGHLVVCEYYSGLI
jgi:hypothetical protein